MKSKLKETERIFKDPVCGMQISYNTEPVIVKYRNKTYCFCAEVCREAFEKDPDLYLVGREEK